MKEQYAVALKCLFCSSELTAPEGKEYTNGDLIKCNQCNEESDYNSIIEIATNEGVTIATNDAKNHIQAELKKIFKGNKFITFK